MHTELFEQEQIEKVNQSEPVFDKPADNPSVAWVVYAPTVQVLPTDDASLKLVIEKLVSHDDKSNKAGLSIKDEIEQLRAQREKYNQKLRTPIQHAAFTEMHIAEKFASYLKNPQRPIQVIELPISSVTTQVDQYRMQILKGWHPVSLMIRNGELLDYWGPGSSWEPYLSEIEKIEYKKEQDDEYLNGTFWARTADQAIGKAFQKYRSLVLQGKLAMLPEHDNNEIF